MKKGFGVAIAAALSLFTFVGCGNVINETNNSEYGSLIVSGDSSRDLSVSSIKKAKVTVTGNGIYSELSTIVNVSSGTASGIEINNIPAGNNRIVSVQGLDSSGNEISDALMKAVTDIKAGISNSCTVNWNSSRKGYVYDALYSKGGKNIRDLSSSEISKIDAAIPDVDAANINLSQFVTDYTAGSLGDKSKYILDGTKTLKRLTVAASTTSTAAAPAFTATAYFSDGTYEDVTSSADWTSSAVTYATVSEGKVTLVAAGTTVITGKYTYGGTTKTGAEQTLTITSGGDLTGKTIIFVKADSVPCIWVWEDGGKAISGADGLNLDWDTEKANPSKSKMTAVTTEYMASPKGWYMYDVSNYVTSGNTKVLKFILNWGDTTIDGKACTFWYNGSTCSENNPSSVASGLSATITAGEVVDPEAPTVTCSAKSGDEIGLSGSITFTVTSNNCDLGTSNAYVNGKSFPLSVGSTSVTLAQAGITTAGTSFKVSATVKNSEGTAYISEFTVTSVEAVTVPDTFTWDNALMYFVIQDRFYNGNTSNDNGYNRKDNTEANNSSIGTFHGGDIAGLTQKLDYLNGLGINAIWITAPYEQAHGWTGGGDNGDFAHFAYHGYYPLDYTMMDRNMGTVEEFRTFVTECHKRGIRVVMDVVMNHTGYLTFKDMKDYSIFPFKSTWSGFDKNDDNLGYSIQYGKDDNGNEKKNFHGHHYYISYVKDTTGNTEWAKWWGSSWVRAGVGCSYDAGGSEDLTKCLNGLPDVKSENTTAQGLPPILETKWNTNGEATSADYAAWRVPAADKLRQNLNVAPMVYIEKWLAAWVEEFGIDGFRCDTAKHVDHYRWGELDALCETALKSWRASSRADDYAKNWDEDFFMTGEAFGWTGGGDWFSNGFNSMIDFTCASSEGLKTYSPNLPEWSARVGSQGLLYISSHDTGLGRWSDQKQLGTKFVLMPGEVQIFYGDETSRSFGDTGSDKNQGTRSDFNWDAATGDCAKHWGKLGTFRKFNPAVGAGTISGDTRTYGDNKVVINTSSNSVSVPYSVGTPVYNWYDGSSTTVSNGTASFSSSVSYDSPLLVSDRNPADYGVTF